VPAAVVVLAGCSSWPASMNPVDWWHSSEGGKIAEQRPPPPKADAPYPGLGNIPARPVLPDAATRGQIASGLVADRANAQYAGPPGPDPSLPGSAPQAFGRGTAPVPAPPASDTPSASLQAASAPPAAAPASPPAQPPLPSGPMTPPRPAPLGKVDSAPLAPPPAVAPTVDAATLGMPAAPPPAPRIPGVDVPTTTVPTPPPVAPPHAPPPPASATTAAAVLVPFPAGSAEMASDAQDALRALVQRRGAAPLQAIGYGDAAPGDPAAQSAALPLALSRARAIAAVLMASGVPSSLVHVEAEAEGRGGAARIAN